MASRSPREKRLQGDLRAVVRQQAAQGLLVQALWTGALPRKDSPEQLTDLSFFPRRDFSGRERWPCKIRLTPRDS